MAVLTYDSTKINDFKTERGNHLQIDEEYIFSESSQNLIRATVYVTKRAITRDTVLIVSPNDKANIKAGYHILLDSIEDIKVGDKIEIQLPRIYSKYLKDRSRVRFANVFAPVE